MTVPQPIAVGDALSELVHQFADPYAFVRELVQNAVFTALNCALAEVTDAHELDFLRWHAAHARTARPNTSGPP